jgi:hypothetical protein
MWNAFSDDFSPRHEQGISACRGIRLPGPAALFNCQRAGLGACCLMLGTGSRQRHKTGEKKNVPPYIGANVHDPCENGHRFHR